MDDQLVILAEVLARGPAVGPCSTTSRTLDMSSMAAQQGVVMLLAERLTSNLRVELPEEVVSKLNVAKRREALFSMLLEVETRRMLAVMEKAAVPGLLLKGQAIAEWAYADPSRKR